MQLWTTVPLVLALLGIHGGQAQVRYQLFSYSHNFPGQVSRTVPVAEQEPEKPMTYDGLVGLDDFSGADVTEDKEPLPHFYRGDVESVHRPIPSPYAVFFQRDGDNSPGERSGSRPWGHNSVPISTREEVDCKEGSDCINRILACYVESWSHKRQEPYNFFSLPDSSRFLGCTHLIYAFAGVGEDNKVKALNQDFDTTTGYKFLTSMKSEGYKVMLSIGGWNQGGYQFSKMASSNETRKDFVDSVLDLLQAYGFDGIDLSWEYPGATDRGGRSEDKENYNLLVSDLRKAFYSDYIISVALPPSRSRVEAGYDLATISEQVDFMNVLTYDMRGHWDGKADHHAAIDKRPHDTWEYQDLNFKSAMQMLVENGADKDKLLGGIPFYARTFTLSDPKETKPGSMIKHAGEAGDSTKEMGFLAYYEYCLKFAQGWTMERDESGSPYMHRGNQWIGYEDEKSVAAKADIIKTEAYRGAAVWAINHDDYHGACLDLSSNLMSTLSIALSGSYEASISETTTMPETTTTPAAVEESASEPTAEASPTRLKSNTAPIIRSSCSPGSFSAHEKDCTKFYHCDNGVKIEKACSKPLRFDQEKKKCSWPINTPCKTASVETVEVNMVPGSSQIGTNVDQIPPVTGPVISGQVHDSGYKVVCYFTNWATYRHGHAKYTPNNIDGQLCTHIIYGFATLNAATHKIKMHDSWADSASNYGLGFYEKVTAYKNKGAKVLIALGGWNDSQGPKYSKLVKTKATRKIFIDDIVIFMREHGFQGLDLDWEYPVCWQTKCKDDRLYDRENFALWVKELKERFRQEPENFLLTAAVSPSQHILQLGYDTAVLNKYLDFINVMTYDYYGGWGDQTGHNSPLYQNSCGANKTYSSDQTMTAWHMSGIDRSKLIMGIPMYGRSFTLKDPSEHGFDAPTKFDGGKAGLYTRSKGFLSYYEICSAVNNGDFQVVHDEKPLIGPYAHGRGQWIGFDDPEIIEEKMNYIKSKKYGGAMIWALDLDDFSGVCKCGTYPLLKTINSGLDRIPPLNLSPDCRRLNGPNRAVASAQTCTLDKSSGDSATPPKPVPTPAPVSTPAPKPVTSPAPKPVTSPAPVPVPSPEPAPSPIPGQTVIPSDIEGTKCNNGEFKEFSGNCNKFFQCIEGKFIKRQCLANNYWDPITKTCGQRKFSSCKN